MKKILLTLCLGLLTWAGYANPDPATAEAGAAQQMVTVHVNFQHKWANSYDGGTSMIDVIANGNELFTMTEGGSGFATIQVPENSQITFEFFADLLANLWYGCEITVNGVNADYMAQLNGEGTSIFYTYRVLPSNYDLYLEVDYRDL